MIYFRTILFYQNLGVPATNTVSRLLKLKLGMLDTDPQIQISMVGIPTTHTCTCSMRPNRRDGTSAVTIAVQ